MPSNSAHFLVISLAAGIAACAGPSDDPTRVGAGSQPLELASYTVDGNPTCEDLGLGSFELKLGDATDGPVSGTFYFLDDPLNSVTIVVDAGGIYFDWTSTLGVDAIIVKGGPNAEVYEFDPEAFEGTGLSAPFNAGSGGPYGLSHISFCYDYELEVRKDASTSFDRTYLWAIDKTGAESDLLLSAGQVFNLSYWVEVWPYDSVEGNFAVSGEIVVRNPSPFDDALVTGVYDLIDESIAADVDCGVSFPLPLASGESFTCSYSAALPDASDRTNRAWAESEGIVGPGEGTAAVSFADAEVTLVDECVTVTDSLAGDLGEVCYDAASFRIDYSVPIGPYEECGSSDTVVNIAVFEANDTGASDSDEWILEVEVADCEAGCTLTPGYWKTHSSYGPAPYDDTWELLHDGADTPFFSSGQSWYDVLWTPPQRGNAYYILARAYIAAVLNGLNGADQGSIADDLADAEAFFEAYTPDEAGGLRGRARNAAIATAANLDKYNNGLIGPGHCDEEPLPPPIS